MAITPILELRARKKVAWLNTIVPEEAIRAFEDRDFDVATYNNESPINHSNLSGISALILTQRIDKPLQITREITSYAEILLNYGCTVIIKSSNEFLHIVANTINKLQLPVAGFRHQNGRDLFQFPSEGDGEPLLPHIRIYDTGASWNSIANFILTHPSSKAPNFDLDITIESNKDDSKNIELPNGADLIIRRAFWDCSAIHLKPIPEGGKSGAIVCRAYPKFALPHILQWAQPYFIKIDKRTRIFKEHRNYQDKVGPFIPFHLGPNIIHERCNLGAKYGILVGDFVEGAEGLVKSARDGRAGAAISCLFDKTLRGWHREAQKEDVFLLSKIRLPSKIKSSRLTRAFEIGATKPLTELLDLLRKYDSTPILIGSVHGDLHAHNVLVRASDAIVIDFLAHTKAPLVCDTANLEASLLVDGFIDVEINNIDGWLESIKELYDHIPLDKIPLCTPPQNPASWFHDCVRQIRQQAIQMECVKHQYAIALAAIFLIKAAKDRNAKEPEASRRAVAYALAERILLLIDANKI